MCRDRGHERRQESCYQQPSPRTWEMIECQQHVARLRIFELRIKRRHRARVREIDLVHESGKNELISAAFGPATVRLTAKVASSTFIPPAALTPYHATANTTPIFKTN